MVFLSRLISSDDFEAGFVKRKFLLRLLAIFTFCNEGYKISS